MGDDTSDLSDYERLRLENIKRNQAQLAALGLLGSIGSLSGAAPAAKKKRKSTPADAEAKAAAKRRRAEAAKAREPERPTRSSGRLRGAKAPDYGAERLLGTDDGEHGDEDEDDAEQAIDYTMMPIEPEHLDDPEFEVYIALRAWRLRKCREIAAERGEKRYEAYKICQNRTLCELVRRRRNDATFAADAPKPFTTGFGREESSESFKSQVLEVWGIGPSKVDAYCPEMVEVLEEHAAKLQSSRDIAAQPVADAAAATAEAADADKGTAAAPEAVAVATAGAADAAAPPSATTAAAEGRAAKPSKPVTFNDFFGKKRNQMKAS